MARAPPPSLAPWLGAGGARDPYPGPMGADDIELRPRPSQARRSAPSTRGSSGANLGVSLLVVVAGGGPRSRPLPPAGDPRDRRRLPDRQPDAPRRRRRSARRPASRRWSCSARRSAGAAPTCRPRSTSCSASAGRCSSSLVIATAAAALSDELLGFGAQWAWTLVFGAGTLASACSGRSASSAGSSGASPSGPCRPRSRTSPGGGCTGPTSATSGAGPARAASRLAGDRHRRRGDRLVDPARRRLHALRAHPAARLLGHRPRLPRPGRCCCSRSARSSSSPARSTDAAALPAAVAAAAASPRRASRADRRRDRRGLRERLLRRRSRSRTSSRRAAAAPRHRDDAARRRPARSSSISAASRPSCSSSARSSCRCSGCSSPTGSPPARTYTRHDVFGAAPARRRRRRMGRRASCVYQWLAPTGPGLVGRPGRAHSTPRRGASARRCPSFAASLASRARDRGARDASRAHGGRVMGALDDDPRQRRGRPRRRRQPPPGGGLFRGARASPAPGGSIVTRCAPRTRHGSRARSRPACRSTIVESAETTAFASSHGDDRDDGGRRTGDPWTTRTSTAGGDRAPSGGCSSPASCSRETSRRDALGAPARGGHASLFDAQGLVRRGAAGRSGATRDLDRDCSRTIECSSSRRRGGDRRRGLDREAADRPRRRRGDRDPRLARLHAPRGRGASTISAPHASSRRSIRPAPVTRSWSRTSARGRRARMRSGQRRSPPMP